MVVWIPHKERYRSAFKCDTRCWAMFLPGATAGLESTPDVPFRGNFPLTHKRYQGRRSAASRMASDDGRPRNPGPDMLAGT